MAFRLQPSESLETGLKRIVSEQIAQALRETTGDSPKREEAVHQVRKRCKKIRALLRLARTPLGKAYRVENNRFRMIAGELAAVRDAEVMVATFDKLLKRYRNETDPRQFSPIRVALASRRDKIACRTGSAERNFALLRKRLGTAGQSLEAWKISGDGFGLIEPGLRRTYRRGRLAMEAAFAQPGSARFHEWRKRVKYFRYQLRLLRDLWRPVMKGFWSEVVELSNLLGEAHDLAVLRQTLLSNAKPAFPQRQLPAFIDWLDRRRTELHGEARNLGRRVYVEKPKHLTRRLHGYWNVWRSPDAEN